jgi:hypothetical protein
VIVNVHVSSLSADEGFVHFDFSPVPAEFQDELQQLLLECAKPGDKRFDVQPLDH